MKITILQLRKIIKEEFSHRRQIKINEAGEPSNPNEKEIKGSIDSVAKSIVAKLGKPELAGALITAIKKAKGGKEAEELSSTDKTALSDAFLELIFKDPKTIADISKQIQKIAAKQ